MTTQFSLADWHRSIICLAYHITQLSRDNNLLPEGAKARGEYFFSDFGIPQPRPSTIIAWASLLAAGPINGLTSFRSGEQRAFNLSRGPVLLPFLPKIRFNEDTDQSLIRTSKAHARDSSDRIQWGSVYIADSQSGRLLAEYSHGNISAKELRQFDSTPSHFRLDPFRGQFPIPPLFSALGDGWQFGIIQNISIPVSLRDSFIELAKRGIPELHRFKNIPKVRRLLFRILDVRAGIEFSKAYSEAAESFVNDSTSAQTDAISLADEIRKQEEQRFKDETNVKRSRGRPAQRILNDEDRAELARIADLTNLL